MSREKMMCPRCRNTDPRYFYRGSRGLYCRRCISFSRMLVMEELHPAVLRPIDGESSEYLLQYPLTEAQEEISRMCAEIVQHKDVLIYAVTGAGKTELTVAAISQCLREGKRVGFAIPRRQVVLELTERFRILFPKAEVTAVCEGYTERLDGDLIVCTTHQLFRYPDAFDVLILDEPDAFPYKGDPVLHGIAATACRGHRIYLTATPDLGLLKQVEQGTMEMLYLNRRPHGHPLPEPHVKVGSLPVLLFHLLIWLREQREHPRLVFVPTIRMAHMLGKFLGLIEPTLICTGKTENRDEVIARFRTRKNGLGVVTTILERGATFTDVQVCVFRADHSVFDEASLTQMAGRAGRTFVSPEGDVLFLQAGRSEEVDKCCRAIRAANRSGAV